MAVRVELLTVGDELLRGDTANGNATWLGWRLTEAGAEVTRSTVVPDDLDVIAGALGEALRRADAVIMTGGLGPTSDDMTREALARAAGVTLRRDPGVERLLRDRAAERHVPLRPDALRMADVPEGAALLRNPAGSAPGLRLSLPGGVVYALPGVPSEMRAIAEESVLPELAGAVVSAGVLRTATIWESVVADRLAPVEAMEGVKLAYYASPGEVRVRIEARGADRLAAAQAAARELLGSALYGVGEVTLDRVVHGLLAEREATVAVAESLTGGLLGARLTAMPGSSATFMRRGDRLRHAAETRAAGRAGGAPGRPRGRAYRCGGGDGLGRAGAPGRLLRPRGDRGGRSGAPGRASGGHRTRRGGRFRRRRRDTFSCPSGARRRRTSARDRPGDDRRTRP